jgi:hypothetical protein
VQPGDRFWLLEVRDEGDLVFRTIHSSRESAVKFLAKWCRAQWAAQGHGQERDLDEDAEQPLPADDHAAVERYFEYWDPEEAYDIDMEGVDPEDTDEVTS